MTFEWTLAEMRVVGVVLLAACLMLAVGPWRRFLARICVRIPLVALAGVLAAFAVLVLLYSLLSLFWPVYPDDVEKDLAAISWWWASGHSMWPSTPEEIEHYGYYPYGPLIYGLIGTSLKVFGPSIFATVLPSILALVVSASGMFWLARKVGASTWRGLAVSMLLIVAVRTMWPWARSDPMGIAFVVLACVLAFNRKGWAIVIGFGLLAGLSSALKIHVLLYVGPAVALMAGSTFPKVVMRGLAMAPFVLITAAALFLLPRADFGNYVFLVGATTAEFGGTLGIFLSNVLYMGMFLGAVLLVPRAEWTGPGEDPLPPERERLFMLCVIIAALGASGIASLRGAGPHHLVPFLPYLGIMIARRLGGAQQLITGEARFLLLAFLIGLHPVSEILKTTQAVFANWSMQDAGRRQIAELARARPDKPISMVYFAPQDGHKLMAPEDPYSLYVYVAFTGTPLGYAMMLPDESMTNDPSYLWLLPKRIANPVLPAGCAVTTQGDPFNVVECAAR